jgi:hypothetical protein
MRLVPSKSCLGGERELNTDYDIEEFFIDWTLAQAVERLAQACRHSLYVLSPRCDAGSRAFDDVSRSVHDEAEGSLGVKELQSMTSGVPIDASLVYARDLSLAHLRQYQLSVDPEALGDERRVDAERALYRALYRLVLEETDEGAPKVWCRSRSGPSLRDMRTRSRSFATDLVLSRARVSSRVAQPGSSRVPCKDTVFHRAQISSGNRLCTS